MNKELLKLLEKINGKKAEVKNLVDQGKLDEAETAKSELVDMQKKFDILKDVLDEAQETAAAAVNAAPQGGAPKGLVQVEEPKDSTHEFAVAARKGFRTDIMQEGGNTGEDGGYTVPEDIQTRIQHYKEANAELRALVAVESVKTDKGARTYQKKTQATGFSKVDENGKIQEIAGPKYERVIYNIEDYAGYMPVTNDLLNDSDANIRDEIVNWIGRNSVATDNREILAIINEKTAVDLEDLKGIKKAINVTLGQAYRAGVRIVTNDDGLNYLDTLEDLNKRPLLNPDPTAPNVLRLRVGATTVPITVIPNEVLATTSNKVPFIVGDLKEGIKIWDRQQTSILASNVASVTGYNAFEQRGVLYRADVRADYTELDEDAYVNGFITVTEGE